jgi:cellulose synthase operon protein C
MKNRFSYLVIISLLFFYGCVSSNLVLEDMDSVYHQLKITKVPDQKDYPESDAVIILDFTHNQLLREDGKLVTYKTRHVIKKIFRNSNDQSTVNIFILGDEKLVDIKARTIRPDGKIINLKPEDFYTISGVGESSVLYANIKTIRFTFPAVEKGCILDYKYQIKENEPFVFDVWQIQNDIPTMRNQYSITMPILWAALVPWQYRTYPVEKQIEPDVDKNQITGYSFSDPITYTWARSKIPAFKPEEMMPPAKIVIPHIRFALSSWEGWKGIAEWYYENYFKSQLVITDSIKSLVHQLTDSSKSDNDKIKSIYNYVRKIRYVEIQFGKSGLTPEFPQTVLSRKYGDCKDKAILFIALLKAAGINSMPVLVLTADDGFIDQKFPSWNFNHMIVKVQDSTKNYWIDPTSEFSPLGTLPWVDQGIQVLTLKNDTSGGIEKTPMPNYTHNNTNIFVHIDLLKNNKAIVNVKMISKGEEARNYRSIFYEKSEKEMQDLCKNMWLQKAIGSDIDSIWINNMNDLDSAFTINFNFHIADAIHQQGKIYYFNPNLIKGGSNLNFTSKEKRIYPIWFPTGYTSIQNTIIHIEDSTLVFSSFPKTVSYQHYDFSYANAIKEPSPKEITSKEVFLMKRATLPSSEYKIVKGFFQNIEQSLQRSIFLKRVK